MNLYRRIDNILETRGMSRRQLAIAAGIPPSTLQSVLSRQKSMTAEMLQQIADAFHITLGFLFDDTEDNPFWDADLENKLKQVGHHLISDTHALYGTCYWIKYADGSLEASERDLKEMHNSINDYILFKLTELRQRHIENFEPIKKD